MQYITLIIFHKLVYCLLYFQLTLPVICGMLQIHSPDSSSPSLPPTIEGEILPERIQVLIPLGLFHSVMAESLISSRSRQIINGECHLRQRTIKSTWSSNRTRAGLETVELLCENVSFRISLTLILLESLTKKGIQCVIIYLLI
jgi:hypothetical protein